MKGLKHFIVRIPEKFSQTFKTESGVVLHADRRFSAKVVMNNVVDVLELPLKYNGPINIGDKLFVDPTVLLWQSYVKGGEQENRNLIDREKGLYKVHPNMIIMHRPLNGNWIGHGENLLLEPVLAAKLKSGQLIIPESAQKKTVDNKGKIAFSNPDLISQGVDKNTVVFTKGTMFVDIWFENTKYLWTKNKYLMAMELKTTG